mmetsp:Transcript_57507/g.65982  ORF Transcript_57507/g.65982 Transcript_57507/m.65982 type:complete len:226 (+) Transcript_57507:473-1150(+)
MDAKLVVAGFQRSKQREEIELVLPMELLSGARRPDSVARLRSRGRRCKKSPVNRRTTSFARAAEALTSHSCTTSPDSRPHVSGELKMRNRGSATSSSIEGGRSSTEFVRHRRQNASRASYTWSSSPPRTGSSRSSTKAPKFRSQSITLSHSCAGNKRGPSPKSSKAASLSMRLTTPVIISTANRPIPHVSVSGEKHPVGGALPRGGARGGAQLAGMLPLQTNGGT